MRSLKRSALGKMLLVVARVIKNQKKQKETSVSFLGKYNAIVKKTQTREIKINCVQLAATEISSYQEN